MKKFFLSLILVMLSSNVTAQDAFEWDASEDTRDIVYETPSSKLYGKWYTDMGDNYFQFNSNGTFSNVSFVVINDPKVKAKHVFSGTWKRVKKMEIHMQITNVAVILDKSDMAKLPARRRDELQKRVSNAQASVKKDLVGQKFVSNIWRLDDDYYMVEEGYDQKKVVYLSEKRKKEIIEQSKETE